MDEVQPAAPTNGPHLAAPESDASFIPLRLVLQPGGLSVELTRPDMLIGRHSDADIRLQLPDVSRRHCRFVFGAGRWQVFDLNSLNGLFVNGRKVRQSGLRDRDVLQIGSCTFQVGLPAVPPENGRNPEQVLGSIANALPGPAEEPGPQRLAS